ncbi:1613_t:CDS:1, partial [Rhizophagus irregularis]
MVAMIAGIIVIILFGGIVYGLIKLAFGSNEFELEKIFDEICIC